ncbi:hypothetical protein BH24ACI4_BH24ACI4_12430 [soil metagenome]
MPFPLRRGVLMLACVLLPSLAHAGSLQSNSDMKEVEAYRLTTGALTKVVNVNRALMKEIMNDPKLQQSMAIRQELEALQEKDELTGADEKRIEGLEKRLEALEEDAVNPLGGDAQSLSEMEAGIRKYPAMVAALGREGMTPREYATFWLAFMQAAFAHGFQKSGMLKDLPPGVNPENVKFIGEHAAEIEAMQKELEAIGAKGP